METKDTLSSCSYSDEQDMQQMLKQAKILKGSCLNGLSALKSNFTRKLEQGITKSEFERAFSHIFGEDVDTFTRTFSQNMDTLEQQLTKETILESNCQNAFRVLKTQFEKIFTSVLIKPSSLDGTRTEYGFKRAFVTLFGQDLETFTGTMFLNMDQLEKQLDKEEFQEIGSMAAFKIQTIEEKFDTSKALDASLVHIESSGTESKEKDTSSRSGNDTHADNVDIRPIYDEELMAEIHEVPTADSGTDTEPLEQVHNDAEYNVFANMRFIPNILLANLIANLKLDVDENKNIQKQLKKANASLAHELKECKSILAETSKTLRESNSIQDRCLIALQNKHTEFERYKALNDCTVDYDNLERKLNETLRLLAQKNIDIKEGLILKAYEISVVKEKHDELVKQSLLTKLHFEGIVKEKTKVITDLKLKEEKDIDKMISMEKQLKFLNEIVYKRNQSIQTIHMLAPKGLTFNGRPTFANPIYLKKAQYEKLCLYEIPYDQSDLANRLVPDREETLTLEKKSRSKLNKDLEKHSHNHFHAPTALDMEVLIKTCLMSLAIKTQNDSFTFVHELKQEMHADLKYVESVENEIDELESDKAEFSNMYGTLLQEYVSNDVMFCNEKASNVFLKEREQYFEIQDLKAQLQDKNIAISELKKLIEKCKGKPVETKFDKPSVVRLPNAQRIPKPSVLGKPTTFSDSLERKSFSQIKSVPKTNVLEGLSKPVTTQILPQTATQAIKNTNVIKPGMYRIDTRKTQTRAPQFPQTSRNTNPRVSTSTGVIHRTNVSRPQLRSTQMKDKVVPNNSHVKNKKTEVEDHHRISSISNKTKSVTASNESLKFRTSNVNAVCATCGKCVFNSNHDACVSKYLNDVNARTKKPKVGSISTRKPKSQANKSVATPHKKTVASESTTQKSKSYYRMLYEKTSKAWKWWIEQQCPSGYKWVPKTKTKWVPKVRNENVQKRIVQLIRFIVNSRCTKHMMGNLTLLCNYVEKYLGTVHLGNDQFALILGYGDLVQGIIMINRVYYVEGLNHNLFSVGQFCDTDLEVAFWKSTCFIRDLQGNDLLTASPTQAWLWHRRLSHLNFDYINLLSKKDVVISLPKLKYVKDQLCSSCEVSKAKRSSFKTKVVPSSKGRLNLLHMDLCGPMRVASINGKKYILVIVDDFSRYTWTLFLRSKDETPEVLKDFLTMIQRNLQAPCITLPLVNRPVYQAQPYQAHAQQMQGVSKTDYVEFKSSLMNALYENIQNQGSSLQNQMTNLTKMLSKFVNSNTASSSNSGSLPSNTITNPKERLNCSTTQNDTAYQGPTIPTSSPKIVERRTEVTKDTIFPTNNRITEDVQPLVIPVENQNPVSEPVDATISASSLTRTTIPYPSMNEMIRGHVENARTKEKISRNLPHETISISFVDALTLMPKFALTLKALIGNKEKLSEMARTPLNEHCSAVILNKLPEKLGDPGQIPYSM
ncbi:retrovirus-related pol polyprotein from transposon TNT 1-94 [Tanacetum coccineum]